MSRITCCFNCADRNEGCHSVCEKYKKEHEKNEAIKKRMRIENEHACYRHETMPKIIDRSKNK